jgi:hypothetical protein
LPWNRIDVHAHCVNEDYAALIDEHPGRFGAFAAVPGVSSEAMHLCQDGCRARREGTPNVAPDAGNHEGCPPWPPRHFGAGGQAFGLSVQPSARRIVNGGGKRWSGAVCPRL